MIFFVPGYDPATEANLALAVRILPEASRALLGESATRERLLTALAEEESALFTLSHGQAAAILEQGGTPALTPDDTNVIGRRPVFAYACHTTAILGRIAARNGATWWGYVGSVTAPDVPEILLPIIGRVFIRIRDAFATAESAGERRQLLLDIAEACHQAEVLIGELQEADPELDTLNAYYCLLHLWQRLRLWESGAAEPIQHPEAPPPTLPLL